MWGDEMKLRAQMSVQDTLYTLRVVELIRRDEEVFQYTSQYILKDLRKNRMIKFSGVPSYN